jgi:hypothetical protein
MKEAVMKPYRFLLVLSLTAFLAGCTPVDSLHPLYSGKNDVVFDPGLLGQWGSENEGMNFAKLGDNGYRIVMSNKDDDTGQITTAVFDAHLVELEGHRFLDVVWRSFPGGEVDEETSPTVHLKRTKNGLEIEPHLIYSGLGAVMELVPGESNGNGDGFSMRARATHEFFKVVMEDEGQTLKLFQLDESWVDSQIRKGNLVIDHETAGRSSTVLTAATPALQRLVVDHVNDEEAFTDATTVHRPAASVSQ